MISSIDEAAKNRKLQVTLIVPTLNELGGIKWFMSRLKKEWYDELIIIDGGSTDGTIEFCKEQGHPIHLQSGKGLPQALEDAFNLSTKDIIITLSPDGNSIPELIPHLVEKMREGYDMVILSRYLGSARSEDDDVFTRFGNKMFTMMINLLFGANYTDALVIYRAYTREAIIRMGLHKQNQENWLRKKYWFLNDWGLGACIRAAKLKLKVSAIPGDEPDRISGVRKMSIIYNGTGILLQILYEFFIGRRYISNKENKYLVESLSGTEFH